MRPAASTRTELRAIAELEARDNLTPCKATGGSVPSHPYPFPVSGWGWGGGAGRGRGTPSVESTFVT